MKAMIFAAGLGTRLKHYTHHKPKALVEVGGMPLLEIQLMRLKRQGFKQVVVNVHHFADLVEEYLLAFDGGDMEIRISDERALLLDTGGGLLHAMPLFHGPGPVYLCNVDVLTDLDPALILHAHSSNNALATLGLLQRNTSRLLTFDPAMRLSGWRNRDNGDTKGAPQPNDSEWAFCGLHVIQPELMDLCQRTGVFSIIDLYLDHAPSGRIHGIDLKGTRWLDVGKPAELESGADMLPFIL